MSLAGLNETYINALLRGLDIRDSTRAELRNFLLGRITTVSDEGEFTEVLKSITQDIEVGGSLPSGQATGEILGALEGGAVVSVGIAGGIAVVRGIEIANELQGIRKNNREEQEAMDRLRDIITIEKQRGVTHGAQGTPSRSVRDLIRQDIEARDRSARKGEDVPEDREFKEDDPAIRQRDRPVTDDGSKDDDKDDDKDETEPLIRKKPSGKGLTPKQAIGTIGVGAFVGGTGAIVKGLLGGDQVPPTITPTKIEKPKSESKNRGRKHVIFGDRQPDDHPDDNQRDDNQPDDNQDIPNVERKPETTLQRTHSDIQEMPLLRPEFKMLGTQYIDELLNVPLSVENNEWVEYNYVNDFDRQNNIEIDNILSNNIRYQKPLFIPKLQKPLRPPSKRSVSLKRIPMKREIQLFQSFEPKFDMADMGRPIEFTTTYNHSVLDSNFMNLRLYNPV